VDQLSALLGRQQAVITEFMKESRDVHSSVAAMENNVTTLGSNLLELKDAMASSTTYNPKSAKKGTGSRLDSKLTVCFSVIIVIATSELYHLARHA